MRLQSAKCGPTLVVFGLDWLFVNKGELQEQGILLNAQPAVISLMYQMAAALYTLETDDGRGSVMHRTIE